MIKCHLCRAESSEVVSSHDRHGNPLETRVCNGCGQVFNNPIPDDEELAEFYALNYRKEYKGSTKPRKRQIMRNFRRMSDILTQYQDMYMKAENVLDVGAGSGEFLYAMQLLGKSAEGIEPNQDYAQYCREHLSINVKTGEILTANYQQGSFDFINLSHVLEHLNDPVRYISILAGWLKHNGTLYIEVPNIFSYAASKSKGNMFHWGHIFNYSPWTLRAVCGLAGLEECKQSAERSKDTTGAYFKKTNTSWTQEMAANPENANNVKQAIAAHQAGRSRQGKLKRLLRKHQAQVSDTINGYRHNDPKDIGTAILTKFVNSDL